MPVDDVGAVPAAFARFEWTDGEQGAGAMLFDPRSLPDPGSHVLLPDTYGVQARPVAVGGRQSAWFVDGVFGAAVLRGYRRGGLAARVSRQRYLWQGEARTRSFAEMRLLAQLRAAGVRVPAPIAGGYWRSGITYGAAILIARIPGVHTLTERVLAEPLSERVMHAVGTAIADMHRAGVWHADLNAFNILLDEQGDAWLIDFDRGRYGAVAPNERRGNVLRLRRSLDKVAGPAGIAAWEGIDAAYRKAWDSHH